MDLQLLDREALSSLVNFVCFSDIDKNCFNTAVVQVFVESEAEHKQIFAIHNLLCE